MLNNQTITKLNEMRMATMAMGFAQQLQTAKYNELSFEERFSLLVDQEWQTRQINRVNRLVKQACFRFPEATIEDIDWNPKRKLDKSHILSLAGCTWINQHLNLTIDGKTGVGKSWMACAIGHSACRLGIKVYSIRLPKLLINLNLARGDGSYTQLMNKLKKIPLLILDDWLLNPLDVNQCRELLELIEERYDRCSTIFSTQWPVEEWYGLLEEPTLADAILDRCIHNSHRIHIEGDTKRKKQ